MEAATVTDGMPSAPVTLSEAAKEAFFRAVVNDRGDAVVAWTCRGGSGTVVQRRSAWPGGASAPR